MYLRYSNKEYQNMNGSKRKQELYNTEIKEKFSLGLHAYLDSKPIGWVAIGPKEDFKKLVKSRTIKTIDDQPVWSIICFYIHKIYRNEGITKLLLEATVEYASGKKCVMLESYPIIALNRIQDEFVYCGTENLFSEVGFVKVSDTNATSGGFQKKL